MRSINIKRENKLGFAEGGGGKLRCVRGLKYVNLLVLSFTKARFMKESALGEVRGRNTYLADGVNRLRRVLPTSHSFLTSLNIFRHSHYREM